LDITDSIEWISDLKVLGNTELWNPLMTWKFSSPSPSF
jgi:hypothetical protein